MMFSTEFSFSAVSSETRMNRLRISFFYRVSLSLFFRLHFTEIHRRERERSRASVRIQGNPPKTNRNGRGRGEGGGGGGGRGGGGERAGVRKKERKRKLDNNKKGQEI